MSYSNFVTGLKNLWEGTYLGTYDAYKEFIIPTIIGVNSPFDIQKAEQLSSVYTCIRILSETIGRMPLNIYTDKGEGRTVDKTDYRYPILHYNPCNWLASQPFFVALEYWRNIKGNSFARIYRDGTGKVKSLVLIPPSKVTKYAVTNEELYYTIINDKNEEEILNASEILHFRTITRDGIWGINPVEALRLNLSATWQGLTTIDSFYKNNATSPKAIKSSTASGASQVKMLEGLEEFKRKYTGASMAGQIIPLPANTEIIDMALNFVDAEFISTLKFNTTQIAALYGVPAWMVGILEQTKFASVETTALDFKNTTLSAIGRAYRQELEFKLLSNQERMNGISIEFNWNALIELDSTTRINNLKALEAMGVPTINDICKLEGFAIYPEGDFHMMPGNYLPVEKIVNTHVKGTNNVIPPQV
jgi:HK97 family phage portal protein